MELHDALDRIAEIRRRVAQTELFRGYRAVPVAVTGLLGIAAAVMQPLIAPDPTSYLRLWISVAGINLAIVAGSLWLRYSLANEVDREGIRGAIGQFAPCVVVGGAITVILIRRPEQVTLLPGLWQLTFGMGLFASPRLMPASIRWIAAFYIACRAVTLSPAGDETALLPG